MASQTVEYQNPDAAALVLAATKDRDIALRYQIDSPAMDAAASEELKRIGRRMKELEEQRKAITKPLDEAKAQVMALYREPLALLEQADAQLKAALRDYRLAQEAKAIALRAEAEKAARLERERWEQDAARDEQEGNRESAEAKRDIAAVLTAPRVELAIATGRGAATMRTTWRARVVNWQAFLKAVAEKSGYHALIQVDQSRLDAIARATEGKVDIEGVECYPDRSIARGR